MAVEQGLSGKVHTSGKTPLESLGARLYVDVRYSEISKFIKVGKRPARFFLNERASELSEAIVEKIEKEEAKKGEKKTPYRERDLH